MTGTRQQQIDGLRQLVQILEDHEIIDVPYFARTYMHVGAKDTDVLLEQRRALGRCTKVFEENNVGFDHKIGEGGLTIQLRLPREDVCEVIGEEEVWVEGYTSPGQYVTKKKYKCPDSIIDKISQVG